jgi:hypothetical protein
MSWVSCSPPWSNRASIGWFSEMRVIRARRQEVKTTGISFTSVATQVSSSTWGAPPAVS